MREENAPGGSILPALDLRTPGAQRLEPRPLVLGRPPPWLALPPMLAISRCFSALIAANPRFEPPELLLFVVGIFVSCLMVVSVCGANAHRAPPFTSLIDVRQL
jgi:hypothetical protein